MSQMRLFCAAAGAAALLAQPAAAAAAGSFQYTLNTHNGSESFVDAGLCDSRPAAITLSGYNEAIHVTTTLGGLTDAQVNALIDSNSDTVTKLTYNQTGDLTVVEADKVVYSGHFQNWFGGAVNHTATVFTGVFHFTASGSDGSAVSGQFTSHETLVNGVVTTSLDKGSLVGCP